MKNWKLKREHGFTFMELIIVVAIILALVSLGAAVATDLSVKYKQKNIDSYAEAIYMAAQNRLLEWKANGMSDKYQDIEDGDFRGGSLPNGDVAPPSDLVYVKSEALGGDGDELLPDGIIEDDLRDGRWIVEYSPSDGSVYAAFFIEEGYGYQYESDYASYYQSYLRNYENRLKEDAQVGYWGGSGGTQAHDAEVNKPQITVTNEEELRVNMLCLGSQDGKDKITFDVTITGETSKKSQVFSKDNGKALEAKYEYTKGDYGYYVASLTLDTLDGSKTFDRVCPNLKEGENFTVTLVAKTDNDEFNYKSTSSSKDANKKTYNSLFGNGSEVKDKDGTVSVCYWRHMKNLKESEFSIATVKQGATLDADNSNGFTSIDTTNMTCYDGGGFTISNLKTSLFQKIGSGMTVKSLSLSNAEVTATSGDAGVLAGTAKGDKIQLSDITLTGADVTAESGNAGVLVGSVVSEGETTGVRMSGVTVTGSWVSATGNAAGTLAGTTEGENIFISKTKVYLEEEDVQESKEKEKEGKNGDFLSGKYVGGLVGSVKSGSVQISYSFAATYLNAAESAGGLVGSVQDSEAVVSVSSSYADCYMRGNTNGGLVGQSSGIVGLDSCYAAGYQTATTQAAGLVLGTLAYANQVYTLADMSGSEGLKTYSTATGFYPTEEGETDLYPNLFYRISGSENVTNEKGVLISKAKDNSLNLSDVTKADGTDFQSAESTSHPYNRNNQNLKTYGFPVLEGLEHYGDWNGKLEGAKETSPLYYYEKYKDGNYDVYGIGDNEDKSNGRTIIEDGYALEYDSNETLTLTDMDGNSWELKNGKWTSDTGVEVPTGILFGYYKNSDGSLTLKTEEKKTETNSVDAETFSVGSTTYVKLPTFSSRSVPVNTYENFENLPKTIDKREKCRHTHWWGESHYNGWDVDVQNSKWVHGYCKTDLGILYTIYEDKSDATTVTIGGVTCYVPSKEFLAFYECEETTKEYTIGSDGSIEDTSKFYTALRYKIGGTEGTAYFNPNFAKTVAVKDENNNAPGKPGSVVIRTARQLYALSEYYDERSYLQDNNLIFNQELAVNYDTYYGAENKPSQKPIGASTAFVGTYNGGGKAIVGASLTGTGTCAGLFGYNNGTIQGVDLQGGTQTLNITASANDSDGLSYAGTLVARNGGTVENCSVSGYNTLCANLSNSVNLCVGGLVGYNGAKVENSSTSCAVKVEGSGNALYAGGLIGSNAGGTFTPSTKDFSGISVTTSGSATTAYVGGLFGKTTQAVDSYKLTDCTVKASGGNLYVGGLVGDNTNGISGCSVVASSADKFKVSATGSGTVYTGALTGANESTLTNCGVTDCTVTGTGNGSGTLYVGGLTGKNNGTITGDAKTSVTCKSVSAEGTAGEANVGGLVGENASGASITSCGMSTYQVSGGKTDSSVTTLYAGGLIGNNLGTVTHTTEGETVAISNGTLTTRGSAATAYVGGLFGKTTQAVDGYTLTDCTVTASDSNTNGNLYVGLALGENAGGVSNTTVNTCTLTATGSTVGNLYAGGLAGQNTSTVDTCTVKDSNITVEDEGVNKNEYVGGLVGMNKDDAVLKNSLVQSQKNGNTIIVGDNDTEIEVARVGGLVGENQAGTASNPGITNCAVAGYSLNLSGVGAYGHYCELWQGGLVGKNSGYIEKCSAVAPNMSNRTNDGVVYQGGFAGSNEGTIDASYCLSYLGYSYSRGFWVGGFAGYNTKTISNSYCATYCEKKMDDAFAYKDGKVTNCSYLYGYYEISKNKGKKEKVTELFSFAGHNDLTYTNKSNSGAIGRTYTGMKDTYPDFAKQTILVCTGQKKK